MFDLRDNPHKYIHFEDKEGRIFVRPDAGDKEFDAEVVAPQHFNRFVNYFDKDYRIVVSQPTHIHKEWRIVIKNGEFVTGSTYRVNGRLLSKRMSFEDDCSLIIWTVTKAAKNIDIPLFCLDVALTDYGYKVVELTSINCAGLYDCDINKVLLAIDSLDPLKANRINNGV